MLTISRLSIVNQALGKLGRLPVTNILDSEDAQLLDLKIDLLLPVLLQATEWNFAIKYVQNSTPLTTKFSTDYSNTFQLPFDYGRMFNWGNFDNNFADQSAQPYLISDGLISTNQSSINYYYIVNNISVSAISILFYRTLVLFIAYDTALVLTKDETLMKSIYMQYEESRIEAIIRNDMERYIVSKPYNSYNRIYIS